MAKKNGIKKHHLKAAGIALIGISKAISPNSLSIGFDDLDTEDAAGKKPKKDERDND